MPPSHKSCALCVCGQVAELAGLSGWRGVAEDGPAGPDLTALRETVHLRLDASSLNNDADFRSCSGEYGCDRRVDIRTNLTWPEFRDEQIAGLATLQTENTKSTQLLPVTSFIP